VLIEAMGALPSRDDGLARTIARRFFSQDDRRRWWLRSRRVTTWPPVGFVRFGNLRRLTPISDVFGADRGDPIDRYYIDDFLRRHTGSSEYAPPAVRGRVLEIGEARYSERFADRLRLEQIDVLDPSPTNPKATVVADLTNAPGVDSDTYDCVICTQTLLLIYEVHAAVRTLHRILKPGGTLLVTVPGISQICRPDMDIWGDYWRFTTRSARRLFEDVFDPADVTVEAYGNVLTSAAFLYGLSAQDLKRDELEARDPNYELLIAVRAMKGAPTAGTHLSAR
jgi:SAM-dependent methyltransferase